MPHEPVRDARPNVLLGCTADHDADVSAFKQDLLFVHTGDVPNDQSGNIGQANYAAAKGGLSAFSKSAALELAKYNITVNVIAPGFTSTDMLAKVPQNVQQRLLEKIPLGRFACPEEIARAVRFLAADADYITGHELNVNGGLYM